jgi:hypothetical protein
VNINRRSFIKNIIYFTFIGVLAYGVCQAKEGVRIKYSDNTSVLITEHESGSIEYHCGLSYQTKINDTAIMHEQWPALHTAITRREFDIAEQIILQDRQQAYLFTPFKNNFHGEYNEESDEIAITQAMQDIKFTYSLGYSALELAILYDSPELVALILECGVDVNLKHPIVTSVNEDLPWRSNPKFDIQIVTPLFFAIKQENSQIVQLLINAGADIEHILLDMRAEFHSLFVATPGGIEDWGSWWSIYRDSWKSIIELDYSRKLSQNVVFENA